MPWPRILSVPKRAINPTASPPSAGMSIAAGPQCRGSGCTSPAPRRPVYATCVMAPIRRSSVFASSAPARPTTTASPLSSAKRRPSIEKSRSVAAPEASISSSYGLSDRDAGGKVARPLRRFPPRGSPRLLRAVAIVVLEPGLVLEALVAAARRAVEPLVHVPEPVESSRVRRIRVVDDAVFQHERAHAGRLFKIVRPIGSGHRGKARGPLVFVFRVRVGRRLQIDALEIVFDVA